MYLGIYIWNSIGYNDFKCKKIYKSAIPLGIKKWEWLLHFLKNANGK